MAGLPSGKYSPEVIAEIGRLRDAGYSWQHIADCATALTGSPCSKDSVRQAYVRISSAPPETPQPAAIPEKLAEHKSKRDASAAKAENRQLISLLAEKDREIEAALAIRETPQDYTLATKPGKQVSATQVIQWSDWHVEETVRPETVNHLNTYNEKVADGRIQRCIENTGRLMQITARETKIDAVVLHLGGDFISGHIHEELMETTWCSPIDAVIWVQRRLAAGIRHLAGLTDAPLIVVCNPGNHSRITHKTHFATEQGNSLEYMLYHSLREALADVKAEWLIAEGYHLYLDLYDQTIRFHHGHAVKYGGGVGGITIPCNKAIAMWNQGRRANLDVFGHFHSLFNGGNFLINGSLIGFSPYALSIKAKYERPRQKFFLYLSSGEVSGEYPIFTD